MEKTASENENVIKTNEIVLEIEELELKIAPGRGVNHNETLVSDIAG